MKNIKRIITFALTMGGIAVSVYIDNEIGFPITSISILSFIVGWYNEKISEWLFDE